MEEQGIEINLDDEVEDILVTEDTEDLEINSNDAFYRGTVNYNKLKNKPQINNVTLQDNKTLDELGIQEKGNYADSRITNTEIEYIFRDW